jgi:hypothetical protein
MNSHIILTLWKDVFYGSDAQILLAVKYATAVECITASVVIIGSDVKNNGLMRTNIFWYRVY